MDKERIKTQIRVTSEQSGQRLDQFLAQAFPEFSRARLQHWLKDGGIQVNGQKVKPSYKLKGLEELLVDVEVAAQETSVQAQDIALDIVHEDDEILLLNKPAGLVVHPAAGNYDGTLVNALLHHSPQLSQLPRAGLVHRLDKLTSGILVVAKTLQAHTSLVRQLQARTMSRKYVTVVYGYMTAGGSVDQPIGRHPRDRKKMAVIAQGKPAVTHYRVAQRFKDFMCLDVQLETGRTHQIRVHMAHIRHPVVGDPVYGGRSRLPAAAGETLVSCLQSFSRQALHAHQLSFEHPGTAETVSYQAPLADDLQQLINALKSDESQQPDHT